MDATLANMKLHYKDGVFAYSHFTGEEFSANPSDYWMESSGWTMTDENDEAMILVTRRVEYVDVTP